MLNVDVRFDYDGYFGNPAQCRVRIYCDSDRPTVVVASELPDNPGTSITNRAERLSREVAAAYGIDPDTLLWVEHYLADQFPERFKLVEFSPTRWTPVPRERIEALTGQPLDGRPS